MGGVEAEKAKTVGVTLRVMELQNTAAGFEGEERKLQKELSKLQGQLSGVRAAAKALGDTTVKEVTQVKKRVMSAAARAKISKATKARWAKFRAQAKKLAKT